MKSKGLVMLADKLDDVFLDPAAREDMDSHRTGRETAASGEDYPLEANLALQSSLLAPSAHILQLSVGIHCPGVKRIVIKIDNQPMLPSGQRSFIEQIFDRSGQFPGRQMDIIPAAAREKRKSDKRKKTNQKNNNCELNQGKTALSIPVPSC